MLKESCSERELVSLCIDGDEEAFELLINGLKPKLKSSMLSAFKNLNLADFEDCWQNTVLRAYQNLSTFRKDSSFKTWLYIILKNEIIALMRTQQRHQVHEVKLDQWAESFDNDNLNAYDLVSEADDKLAETACTIIESREKADAYKKLIEKAISTLEPKHSNILTKVLIDGKSYKEVAAELNMPIGTIMSRLHYARKTIQKTIRYFAQLENIELPS